MGSLEEVALLLRALRSEVASIRQESYYTRTEMNGISKELFLLRERVDSDFTSVFDIFVQAGLYEAQPDAKLESQEKCETADMESNPPSSNVTIRNSTSRVTQLEELYPNIDSDTSLEEELLANPMLAPTKASPTTSVKSNNTVNTTSNINNVHGNGTTPTNNPKITKSNGGVQPTASRSMIKPAAEVTKASIRADAPAGDPSGDPSDSDNDPDVNYGGKNRRAKKSKSQRSRRSSFFEPQPAPLHTVGALPITVTKVYPTFKMSNTVTVSTILHFWKQLKHFNTIHEECPARAAPLLHDYTLNRIASTSNGTMSQWDVLALDNTQVYEALGYIIKPRNKHSFMQQLRKGAVFKSTIKELNTTTFGEFFNNIMCYITDFLLVFQLLSKDNTDNTPPCVKTKDVGSIWLFNDMIPHRYGFKVLNELTITTRHYSSIEEYVTDFSKFVTLQHKKWEICQSLASFLIDESDTLPAEMRVATKERTDRVNNIQHAQDYNYAHSADAPFENTSEVDAQNYNDDFEQGSDDDSIAEQLAVMGPPVKANKTSSANKLPCFTALHIHCRSKDCKYSHSTNLLLERSKQDQTPSLDQGIKERAHLYNRTAERAPQILQRGDRLHALSK